MATPRAASKSAWAFMAPFVLLYGHLAGCHHPGYFDDPPGFPTCQSDADCQDGLVCAQLPGFSDLPPDSGTKRCTKPCTSSADCAPCPGCTCHCAQASAGVCQLSAPPRASDAGEPDELCRADYDPKAACGWLCSVCSCAHKECGGGVTSDQCAAGCMGSFDAFPACAMELDAFYFCGQRHGTCAPGANGYPALQSEASCPAELAALTSCVSSKCPTASCSTKFFFPVAN